MPDQPQHLYGIHPKLRDLVLRFLDRLPRGEVNDVCIALENAPILNITETPPSSEPLKETK